MWRLTNVPSQAMTTVYLLKQMIRPCSASSSWNTFQRFLLKTHRGPAQAAGSPPPSLPTPRESQPQSQAEAAAPEPAMPLSQHSAPRRWLKSRSLSLPRIFRAPSCAWWAPVQRCLCGDEARGRLVLVAVVGAVQPGAGSGRPQAHRSRESKGRGRHVSDQITKHVFINKTISSPANSEKHWSIRRLWNAIFFSGSLHSNSPFGLQIQKMHIFTFMGAESVWLLIFHVVVDLLNISAIFILFLLKGIWRKWPTTYSFDCPLDKELPLWCKYSVKYENLFLGINSTKIWLVEQIPWAV